MCAINKASENQAFFDFEDGRGPVPAHKHPHGGGWVADTAEVENSVYVGPCARVYGHTHIYNNVRIEGFSAISDYAQVCDNVRIGGNVRVSGHALLEGDIVLEKNCFIGGGTHLKGSVKIGDHATFMQTTRCLNCPLLQESYGATTENPCVNCLSAVIKRYNETGSHKTGCDGRYPYITGESALVSAFKAGNDKGAH